VSSWPWLFLGALAGLIYFLLLWWAVDRLCFGAGRRAGIWLVVTGVGRLVLIAVVLVSAVLRGAPEALLAFCGFWLTRWPLLYWWSQHSGPSDRQS
jgi:hypothetical protein